ncbi:nuclear transport factor 2 family protein [Nocardioides xinjiangensis]|uniref:nuclear transport factor 2 family protein n=1 Tax=Nocardioides xinjiangensis TaxID=2817376 RepID=UPI001B303333|nr:nuclear transport factor 2 family protein [Nocardioides sp. SYSU D00514]
MTAASRSIARPRTALSTLAATAVGAVAAGALALPTVTAAAPAADAATSASRTATSPVPAGNKGLTQHEKANRRAAVRLLVGAFTKHDPDTYARRYIDANTYIQHNPLFDNGRDAFIAGVTAYLEQFPDYTLRVRRTVTQGNYVVVHALAKVNASDRGTVEIDVFRFNKAGKIVEHWDALQPVAETSVNGNPQV